MIGILSSAMKNFEGIVLKLWPYSYLSNRWGYLLSRKGGKFQPRKRMKTYISIREGENVTIYQYVRHRICTQIDVEGFEKNGF